MLLFNETDVEKYNANQFCIISVYSWQLRSPAKGVVETGKALIRETITCQLRQRSAKVCIYADMKIPNQSSMLGLNMTTYHKLFVLNSHSVFSQVGIRF